MIDGGKFEGIVYRAVHPQFMRTAGVDVGSTIKFGRFNRLNDRALYTALDPETAYLEYQQGEKRPKPCLIIAYDVKLHSHADFTAGYVPRVWKGHWRDALLPGWRVKAHRARLNGTDWTGWLCGDEVRGAGHAGLLVPSVQNSAKAGRNLILYQDARGPGEFWNDIDDQGDIRVALGVISAGPKP